MYGKLDKKKYNNSKKNVNRHIKVKIINNESMKNEIK